jgi:hypothetical protein
MHWHLENSKRGFSESHVGVALDPALQQREPQLNGFKSGEYDGRKKSSAQAACTRSCSSSYSVDFGIIHDPNRSWKWPWIEERKNLFLEHLVKLEAGKRVV